MTDFRESISQGGINSSDLAQHEYRSAVDKIGALGRAPELGREWYHYKFADRGHGQAVLKNLLQAVMGSIGRMEIRYQTMATAHPEIVKSICMQIIAEQMYPICRRCKGRAYKENQEESGICFIVVDRKIVVCPDCDGVGVHKYTKMERANNVGLDIGGYVKWLPIFEIAQYKLSAQDVRVNRVLNEQLTA